MSFKNSLSTGHHCVVYGCSYNQKKRNAARKELCGTHNVLQEVCGCNVYLLHRFPADADLKRQWVAAVNRKDFVPLPSSRVCSAHFVDGKRTDLNPVPMIRLVNAVDQQLADPTALEIVVGFQRPVILHSLQVACLGIQQVKNYVGGSHSRPLSHVVQPSLHHVRMVITAAA